MRVHVCAELLWFHMETGLPGSCDHFYEIIIGNVLCNAQSKLFYHQDEYNIIEMIL